MLIPEPKQVRELEGVTRKIRGLRIVGGESFRAEELLRRKLWNLPKLAAGEDFPVEITPFDSVSPEASKKLFLQQGYCLQIGSESVQLQCASREGLGHGLSTLKQLLVRKEEGYAVRRCEITDWPLIEKRKIGRAHV